MDHVVWDQGMSVGVEVLDEDHRRLFGMFNALLKTGVIERNKDDLSRLLADLDDYTKFHFAREEEFMERCAYPDLDQHRAAHRYFEDEVRKQREEFDAGDAVMLRIDLILLLKEWLVEHIQTVDKQYRPFMEGKVEAAAAG